MSRDHWVPINTLLRMKKVSLAIIAAVVAMSAWFLAIPNAQAAGCPTPTADLGSATMSVSVATAGTYRVWSRIMAPDTTNNSYSLDVDGTSCYTVGDSQVPAGAWTWVDYQGGNSASKINMTLTAGTHNLKLVGREAGVAVDRVIMVADTTCVPTNTGNNCLVDVDQTPPVVSLTAPAADATVNGKVNVAATATDTGGIGKVEFYVDNTLKTTVAAAPYTYSWDTAAVTNTAHSLSVKAYDKSGNVGVASVNVTVQNGDTQAPTAPTNVSATASSPTTVDVKWNASTDNVGVAGYYVQRNNVTIGQIGTATTYKDTATVSGTSYSYRVLAFDAAGNNSAPSTSVNVTTPKPTTTDTEAPSVPGSVSATAVGSTQVNLKWNASADNVGVAKYNVYRGNTKIATVTTTSYGDTGLNAGTKYSYYVTAEDAAGNVSAKSTTASATTAKATRRGHIKGKVTTSDGKALSYARVTVWVNGDKRVEYADRKGNYDIGRLPAGTYTVKYSDRGHTAQTQQVAVTDGQTVTKNVSLKRK